MRVRPSPSLAPHTMLSYDRYPDQTPPRNLTTPNLADTLALGRSARFVNSGRRTGDWADFSISYSNLLPARFPHPAQTKKQTPFVRPLALMENAKSDPPLLTNFDALSVKSGLLVIGTTVTWRTHQSMFGFCGLGLPDGHDLLPSHLG